TGLASWGSHGTTSNKLNDLLLLSTTPETIVKSVHSSECKQISTNVWENQYFRAEYIPIYIEKTYFPTAAYSGGRVVAGTGTNANGFYFVSLANSDDASYYTVNGIKITLKSATMNRYIYAKAGVKDVTNNNITTIDIAIRVNNTALDVFKGDSGKIATYGNKARENAYSEYAYNGSGVPTFTYKIPLNGTVVVTPYDFALDYDMRVCGVNDVAGGFTLNGYSGRYNSSTGTLVTGSTSTSDGDKQFSGLFSNSYNTKASTFLSSIKASTTVAKASTGTTGTATSSGTVANAAVPRDKLFFERTTTGNDAYTYNPTTFNNFYNSRANSTNFVDLNFGTNVKIGGTSYAVDFVMFTAINRTTQPAVIDLKIRDRFGSGSSDVSSSSSVRIIIEVVNTKTAVKNSCFYSELSVKPISDGNKIVTPDVTSL
ncbi:MAG: hypothetical protein K2L88_01375, partial [Clostridiales bacterium]|nr:hypothetical protein [Clostridiales bacterium]